MTVTADTTRDLEMAAAARLLSLGFLPPTAEVVGLMRDLAAALGEELPEGPLAQAVAAVLDALPAQAGLMEMAGEHHRLFGGAAACPPYETSYAPDPFQQARQMADIAGFYAAFGADPSGPAGDRCDQLGCELEFLAFLVAARVVARQEGRDGDAGTCARAEDVFLRDHLGRWLGPFCLELERTTAHPTYLALARLGQRYAVAELERRGLHADPVLARRIRTVVERDSFVCGAEAGEPAATLDAVLGRGPRTNGGP